MKVVLNWSDHLHRFPYVLPSSSIRDRADDCAEAHWGMGQHIYDLDPFTMQESLKVAYKPMQRQRREH